MPGRAAIAIPTRDRPRYLDVALASIAPQAAAYGAEVVVIDDGTDPGTRAVAGRHGARYVARDGPRGINVARNTAIDVTNAPLVVYVDDDVEVHPGWLAALLGAADACPDDVGVLTGPIRPRIEDHRFRTCGREGPPVTFLDAGPEDADIARAWGANMAVRRSAIEAVGRFAEHLVNGGDEEELKTGCEDRRRADPLRRRGRYRPPARGRRRAPALAGACVVPPRPRGAPVRRAARERPIPRRRAAGPRRLPRPRPALSLLQRRDDERAQRRPAARRARRGDGAAGTGRRLPLGRQRDGRRQARRAAAAARRLARHARGGERPPRAAGPRGRGEPAARAGPRARHRAPRHGHGRGPARARPQPAPRRGAYRAAGAARQVREPQRAARRAPAGRLRLARRRRRRRAAPARLPRHVPPRRRDGGPAPRPARPPPALPRRLDDHAATRRGRRARDHVRRDRPRHGVPPRHLRGAAAVPGAADGLGAGRALGRGRARARLADRDRRRDPGGPHDRAGRRPLRPRRGDRRGPRVPRRAPVRAPGRGAHREGAPVNVAVVAEFYPRAHDPVLGIWAHRQAIAARDAGADVRVLVLYRPIPPLATAPRDIA